MNNKCLNIKKKVKFYFVIFFYLVYLHKCGVIISNSNNNNNVYGVSGKVLKTSIYCGGAMPTQEVLDNLKIPKPYPDKKFYIKSGKINNINSKIISKFISKTDGSFSITLEPGFYSILLEEQIVKIDSSLYQNKNQSINIKCAEQWWKKPYYILEVKDKDINNLNFIFHDKCFIKSDIPCITYKGPLPQ